jgi:hypothetical protein
MAFDYQYDAAEMQRLADEERRMQEEQQRQAEEAARAQQQAQRPPPGTNLGALMREPAPANPYASPPPGMSWEEIARERGTVRPQDAAPAPAPQEAAPAQAPASYAHDPNRDYSRNPLTGAEFEAFKAAGGKGYLEGATSYYGGGALPTGTATPGREGSSIDVDEFNKGVRGSELYQQFVGSRGLRNGKWSDSDREAWRNTLRQAGVQVPDGMKIDDAGNLNQVNKLGKRLIIGGAIVGGTLLTAGALGAFGGAAAAGGAASGAAGAGAAAGAAGAGAAAAGTGAAVAGGAAAAAGAGAGMGIMPSVITGLAGLGSTYMGARAQSQAGKQAAAASERAAAASERTLIADREFEREQRAQERADAERRWAAEQEMARKMWEAQEDERLYERKIREEDRAAMLARNNNGPAYSGPSGPDPRQLRREQAQRNLAALLAQHTPGQANPYTPATAAGPVGRG